MRGIAVLTALGVTITSPALAGPDAIGNRFLNDTPSMLDFGMFKLGLDLKERGFMGMAVWYDWDRNRILVRELVLVSNEWAEDPKAHCQSSIRNVRQHALVNLVTGSPLQESGMSGFARHFAHVGFSRTIGGMEEEAALKALDKMFLVRSEIYNYQTNRQVLACEGPLLGTQISYEE